MSICEWFLCAFANLAFGKFAHVIACVTTSKFCSSKFSKPSYEVFR
ncbi:hypothetical protein ANASTE_00558 [Anaerofustis stercorihominis DSM 17244]|uniref:Uncharacterized protein n=1 Tax=Anaerofustis stercorihominis DSM 17244 TaxID=445971 RepID=B1C760_9FIRM|nr:hypothetical protein ANASTE_00558 [Anaerofustis stercorihominis DSM 17244]